jgi:hypothetical protein
VANRFITLPLFFFRFLAHRSVEYSALQGKLVRQSSKQGNRRVAVEMEAAHKTRLAKNELGIHEVTKPPTLIEFGEMRCEAESG